MGKKLKSYTHTVIKTPWLKTFFVFLVLIIMFSLTAQATHAETGPPSTPNKPQVTKTTTSDMTVNWTAPSSNPSITDYDVRYRVNGTTNN